MVAVCEPLPKAAVTVAWSLQLPVTLRATITTVRLLAMEAAAVALKVAALAPAATVTDAGTVSAALLLASVTLDPPAGAAWGSVTVHVLTPLCPRLAGLHTRVKRDNAAAGPATATFSMAIPCAVVTTLPEEFRNSAE